MENKIERTKGELVNLESKKGGFILELNYYEKDSPFNTEYTVGERLELSPLSKKFNTVEEPKTIPKLLLFLMRRPKTILPCLLFRNIPLSITVKIYWLKVSFIQNFCK